MEKRIAGVYGAKLRNSVNDDKKSKVNTLTVLDSPVNSKKNIIVIGASTGGTEAVKQILTKLPPEMPPILIVQHLPKFFTKPFAQRLNELCRLEVKEAEHNEAAVSGKVLIAPGGKHMILRKAEGKYSVQLSESEPVHYQRPSVEVLFDSAAECAGPDAVGVILTGIGKDGAGGLLKMKQAGAYTIGQDEESCVVYGMPKEAVALGAVERCLTLEDIARELQSLTAPNSMTE